jgi:Acetyltransferase (GNAT) family
MVQMTVRRVRPEDAARVRAVRLEMLADAPLAYLERIDEAAQRPHADYRARIAQVSGDPEVAQFIAESDGRIVGHAGGWAPPNSAGVTMLYAVYVTPAWRGGGVVDNLVEGSPRGRGRPDGTGWSSKSWSATTGPSGPMSGWGSSTPAGARRTPRSPLSPRC